jgi:hypothetical protein
MNKKQFSVSEERALTASIISVILMQLAAKVLKQENKFYQHNVRNWIFKWEQIVAPTIWQIEKLKKLFIPKKELELVNQELGTELEAEDLENDLNCEVELFQNFIALYLNSNTTGIYELNMIIENLLAKQKVYTEQEVEDVVNRTLKTITPAVKYDVNTYKRFMI